MLNQLAAARSTREVWWILGAREPREHPLAAEAHALLASLPHAREHVFYSATAGRLSKDKLLALDVPADASAYICGPTSFLTSMHDALTAAGLDFAAIDEIAVDLDVGWLGGNIQLLLLCGSCSSENGLKSPGFDLSLRGRHATLAV